MKLPHLLAASLLINHLLAPFPQARTPMSSHEAWELSHSAYCEGILSDPSTFLCRRVPDGDTGYRIIYLDNGAPEIRTSEIIKHETAEDPGPADCWQVPFDPPSTWPVNAFLACLPHQPRFVVAVFVDAVNQLIHIEKRGLKDKVAKPLMQPISGNDCNIHLSQNSPEMFIPISHKTNTHSHHITYLNLDQEGALVSYPLLMEKIPDPVQGESCITYMAPAHLLSEFCIHQRVPK